MAHIKIKELVKCVVPSGLNILKAAHANSERSLDLISYTLSGMEYHGWHTHQHSEGISESEIITVQ